MPKEKPLKTKARKVKKPGRIAQMWKVFQMTRRYEPSITWIMLLSLLGPVVIGVAAALLFDGGVFGWILWILTGLLAGVLIALIVLGRKAEKAAYQQIEGQPGAVGAVIKNALRRSWTCTEMPVAVSPKTQDAVYRVIGRGGVVLIGEGPQSRTKRLVLDEERKVKKVLPNVAVIHVFVGPDEDSVPLYKISSRLLKLKPTLNKREVLAVSRRLASLQASPVGIPKGIDPNKIRAQRPR
jgi:uncharacterized membrane protein YeaQ/YmgE (transglycosylase-associated protein family)